MNKLLKKNKKGTALIFVLTIMTIVMIILVSMLGYVASQIKYSYYEAAREQSLQIAEAGAYFYRWYLAHEVEGKTAQQIQDFWNGSPYGIGTPYEVEYKDPQGAGIGKFSVSVTPPEEYSSIVIVQSTGWTYKNPDHQRTVKVRFRRPSWSEYAVLSDVETSYIRFGDGTEVFGPLRVNGGVHFDGVAHNTVASGTSTYYDNDIDVKAWKNGVWTAWAGEYNTTMDNTVFIGGKDYPVPIIDFSGLIGDLAVMKTEAQNTGDYYDDTKRGRHIILKTNGTYDIRTVQSYNSDSKSINSYNGSWSNKAIPDNGVIFVEDNIWLEGKINNKRVTVTAGDLMGGDTPDIYIEHSIEYTNYDCTETVGIISEGDIQITENSDDILRIDGALVSQTGKIGRGYYTPWWCHAYACEDHKDTITVYGSLATKERYGFAYTDGTGYQTRNLIYDNNLLYCPPPYFPTESEYSLDLWEEL